MTASHLASVETPAAVVTPRLLAFYRDAWNDDGNVIGWRTVAWGLVLADGSAISIPVEPPVRVTLWHNVDDALVALDAYVDNPDPRRTVDDGRDVQPPPPPFTVQPAPVEGVATLTARADDPRGAGRNGPLGTGSPIPREPSSEAAT